MPTASMYLLDSILSEDERNCVNIMHDPNANTFAFVVEEQPNPAVADAADLETRRAMLIGEVELKAIMALGVCQTVDEATACRGALTSTVAQSARLRIKELGGDVDEATSKLDEFSLTHPEH